MKKNVNNYCGVRMEKIKNVGAMFGKEKHNFRSKDLEFGDNVNLELSEKNRIWKFNDYKNNMISSY